MRRRYVLALVLATALVFSTVGYYARTMRDDEGESAACIRFRALIEQNTDYGSPSSDERAVMTAYDDFCR